jgi:hypothetical protein
MVYYYIDDNGKVIETRTRPTAKNFIKLKRTLPVPCKTGYDSCLRIKENRVFYELIEKKEYKKRIEIANLKQKLKDTDYKAIKYAEGQLTEEEYASTKVERQSWRDRINELEAQIMSQAIESEATENG